MYVHVFTKWGHSLLFKIMFTYYAIEHILKYSLITKVDKKEFKILML